MNSRTQNFTEQIQFLKYTWYSFIYNKNILKQNEELYTKIGNFFPFAVGKETKKSMASVLLEGS